MKWLFRKATETEQKTYDPNVMRPVIRSSICTGEKVAGFRHLQTGKFEEVMLVRGDADREAFLKMYGIRPEDVRTEY